MNRFLKLTAAAFMAVLFANNSIADNQGISICIWGSQLDLDTYGTETQPVKVTGEEFINCHDTINQSITKNIELVDHSSQFSIYFDDPDGNPYEITSYDYEMLSTHYST